MGSVSFAVRVVDTTKPALNAPPPQNVSSRGASTLSKSDPQVVEFLGAAVAQDLVSGSVPVTNNAPDVLPLGTTRVTFTATDAAGNRATAQSELTVVTRAVTPQVRDLKPPSNVTKLRACPATAPSSSPGSRRRRTSSYVTIARSPGKGKATSTVLYKGWPSGSRTRALRMASNTAMSRPLRQGREFLTRNGRESVPNRPLLYRTRRGRTPSRSRRGSVGCRLRVRRTTTSSSIGLDDRRPPREDSDRLAELVRNRADANVEVRRPVAAPDTRHVHWFAGPASARSREPLRPAHRTEHVRRQPEV